jgi:hypothetical protein
VGRRESCPAGCGRATARPLAALTCIVALAACVTTSVERSPAQSAQTAADAALANTIYSTLNADPTYFFRHVDVRVANGVAYLSGYVWTTDAIYRARQIARGVPGVTKVVTNHLELERNGLGRGPAR